MIIVVLQCVLFVAQFRFAPSVCSPLERVPRKMLVSLATPLSPFMWWPIVTSHDRTPKSWIDCGCEQLVAVADNLNSALNQAWAQEEGAHGAQARGRVPATRYWSPGREVCQ